MKNVHIISVWVENKAGVLSKVSGLFASRGYNILSLSVGETEDPEVSRMTIVVEGDDKIIEQVKKQLNKLIDTIKVIDFTKKSCINKELCYVKLNMKTKEKSDIIMTSQIFGAKIVDIGKKTITIEIVDTDKRVNEFLKLVSDFGIIEIARSGIVAIAEDEK
ncbi:MAG TPA: acetolactate synthase small subunit [Spirochaetota bacterium]|nr:acetolactate synthase small subunit [Spirochaetota bacterium]HOM38310.1 acetolactate synthase small subunit [Spirochaetota bacterium]HPQ48472.1 acetolactate synthase small subunit [Spirochaetota bacterium]